MDPKSDPQITKNGVDKLSIVGVFVSDVWSRFGFILGASLGSKRAKKRRDGPKKDVKSLKVPNNSICKKYDCPIGKTHFRVLGGIQDEHNYDPQEGSQEALEEL